MPGWLLVSCPGPCGREERSQGSCESPGVYRYLFPKQRYQPDPRDPCRYRSQRRSRRHVPATGPLGNTSRVPRKTGDVPAEVEEVASALLALSHKEGLTRAKLTRSPPLLALTAKRLPEGSPAERARVLEDMIRTHVNSIRNLRDRLLLAAGLNLDQVADSPLEKPSKSASTKRVTSRSARQVRTSSNPKAPRGAFVMSSPSTWPSGCLAALRPTQCHGRLRMTWTWPFGYRDRTIKTVPYESSSVSPPALTIRGNVATPGDF